MLCAVFQFPDIVEFCEEMANAGKTVIVAALDGTFQRKVCLSDDIVINKYNNIMRVCMCFPIKTRTFNACLSPVEKFVHKVN